MLKKLMNNIFSTNMQAGGSITINGKSYNGNSIYVDGNGNVTVDGVKQDESIVGEVNVVLHGNADMVQTTSGTINVAGDVNGSVSASSGSITVGGDVKKNVSTSSGNVKVSKGVGGNTTTTSGNIKTGW